MRSYFLGLCAAAFLLSFSPAAARNIVLTNDDGLTSNILALYHALKSQGHDVVVSVPCTNQSGMGAAAYFSRPVTPLTAACRNAAGTVRLTAQARVEALDQIFIRLKRTRLATRQERGLGSFALFFGRRGDAQYRRYCRSLSGSKRNAEPVPGT